MVGGTMKKFAVAILLFAVVWSARAQSKPVGACQFAFAGFALAPGQEPKVAEVATKGSAKAWLACDSPKGCIAMHVDSGAPMQIYQVRGPWTCGYEEDSHGGGPLWFRTSDLRVIPYSLHPSPAAWQATWTGGEDRVVIRLSKDQKSLRLRGSATWKGNGDDEHLGDLSGEVTPHGNHAHFVSGGCEVDMTLAGKFILASDNEGCGGLNARFQGWWKRAAPLR